MQSEERLRRLERLTELPLLALALALVPLLILPEVLDLSASVRDGLIVADWFIWAVFAVDFTLKLTVAPARLSYIRSHWLELLMVVLPFLRPLRAARLLRLGRVAAVLGVNIHLLQDMATRRGPRFVAAAVLVILVSGATLAFLAERQDQASNIGSFGDALWWAATTMTTVGYGDRYPVTPMGRGVGVLLMLLGIAAVSALTATVSAYLVKEEDGAGLADILAELRALRAEVEALRASEPTAGGISDPIAD